MERDLPEDRRHQNSRPENDCAPVGTNARHDFLTWAKAFASTILYATLIVTFGGQFARVEGRSMDPTLHNQDRLIVNKAAYQFFGEPQRGDIVMLRYPRAPEEFYVKRIVAVAGDTLRIEDGKLFVNGQAQPEAFVPPEYRSHDSFGPVFLQAAHYFVMGDHRNSSSDSRHWGQVPEKYIIGRVELRWWPLPDARFF